MRISSVILILAVGIGLGVAGTQLPRWTAALQDLPQIVSRNANGLEAPQAPVASAAQPAALRDTTQRPRGSVEQLSQIVAFATRAPSERSKPLTPEQKEIVAFFERTAREMNEAGGQRLSADLEFDHLAIDGLRVRYFYTVRKLYQDLNPRLVLNEQTRYITQTLCSDPAGRQLIEDYGFDYSYSYLSKEHRLIGRINGDLGRCSV